jgi:hypothetical protein
LRKSRCGFLSKGFVHRQKTPCFEAMKSYERGEWSKNEGRNEQGCLQDTGAAVTKEKELQEV